MTETDKCTQENWIENFFQAGDRAAEKIETASALKNCAILIGPPKAQPNYPADWLTEHGIAGMYRGEPL